MNRTTLILASLLAMCAAPAFAQVVVSSSPVVTYYTPSAPVITSYSPTVYSSTVVGSPVVEYAAPVTVSRPVTTYYAPATSYVAPTTSYYAPVTTYYGGTVVTPAYGSPVTVGRSLYGTLTPYVPGQPVRNTLRFALP